MAILGRRSGEHALRVAIDLNKGEIKWSEANGDGLRDHPAIKHLNLPPLGNPGRVGPTVTRSLVVMGEGFNTHNGGGPPSGGKKFRQYIVVATGWTDRPGELVALALP